MSFDYWVRVWSKRLLSNAMVWIHSISHFQTNQFCFHRSFVEFKNITAMFLTNVRITVIYTTARHLCNVFTTSVRIVRRYISKEEDERKKAITTIFGFAIFYFILFYLSFRCVLFLYTKYLLELTLLTVLCSLDSNSARKRCKEKK